MPFRNPEPHGRAAGARAAMSGAAAFRDLTGLPAIRRTALRGGAPDQPAAVPSPLMLSMPARIMAVVLGPGPAAVEAEEHGRLAAAAH